MIRSNTCLAMLKTKKGLVFAGDRRISWGMHKAQKAPRSKVTNRNGVLLAGTGVSCICDLVTDLFNVPAYDGKQDTFNYMHKTFLPALMKYLREEKWLKEDGRGIDFDDDDRTLAIIVVGVGKDLYELDMTTHCISVDAISAPYAHGCGGMYALGSLLTTEKLDMDEEERLKLALQIAAKVSPGCDAHVDIVRNDV